MDPVIGAALIGAGGGLLEGLLSGRGQSRANRDNINLSRDQMAFQERMSSTAYQRSVQDMRKAGINPLLLSPGGASTPGGSLPSIQNTMEGYKGTTAKALEAGLRARESRALESQIDLNQASAREIAARTKLLGLKTPEQELQYKFYELVNRTIDQFISSSKQKGVVESIKDKVFPKTNYDDLRKKYYEKKGEKDPGVKFYDSEGKEF